MHIQQQIKLDILSQAGQVALEFLRASPDADPKETSENYNKVFKQVYEGMTDIVTNK